MRKLLDLLGERRRRQAGDDVVRFFRSADFDRTRSAPWLSCLARAYAELSRYDDAWRCIGEAMTLVEGGLRLHQ